MDARARTDVWSDERVPRSDAEFDAFFAGVAHARYVLRRATRMVDQEARAQGLDPLEHQLLLQLFSAADHSATVTRVSARLYVAPAMGSRLAIRLEERGLVTRHRSPTDRRATEITLTPSGRQRCVEVCVRVRDRIIAFGEGFTVAERRAALDAFAYYVGAAFSYAAPRGISPVEGRPRDRVRWTGASTREETA